MTTASNLPPPSPFDIHEVGAAGTWKEWRARFTCYMRATKLDKEEAAVQVSILLTVIGAEVHTLQSVSDIPMGECRGYARPAESAGQV